MATTTTSDWFKQVELEEYASYFSKYPKFSFFKSLSKSSIEELLQKGGESDPYVADVIYNKLNSTQQGSASQSFCTGSINLIVDKHISDSGEPELMNLDLSLYPNMLEMSKSVGYIYDSKGKQITRLEQFQPDQVYTSKLYPPRLREAKEVLAKQVEVETSLCIKRFLSPTQIHCHYGIIIENNSNNKDFFEIDGYAHSDEFNPQIPSFLISSKSSINDDNYKKVIGQMKEHIDCMHELRDSPDKYSIRKTYSNRDIKVSHLINHDYFIPCIGSPNIAPHIIDKLLKENIVPICLSGSRYLPYGAPNLSCTSSGSLQVALSYFKKFARPFRLRI